MAEQQKDDVLLFMTAGTATYSSSGMQHEYFSLHEINTQRYTEKWTNLPRWMIHNEIVFTVYIQLEMNWIIDRHCPTTTYNYIALTALHSPSWTFNVSILFYSKIKLITSLSHFVRVRETTYLPVWMVCTTWNATALVFVCRIKNHPENRRLCWRYSCCCFCCCRRRRRVWNQVNAITICLDKMRDTFDAWCYCTRQHQHYMFTLLEIIVFPLLVPFAYIEKHFCPPNIRQCFWIETVVCMCTGTRVFVCVYVWAGRREKNG